jgi:hypothetical protein
MATRYINASKDLAEFEAVTPGLPGVEGIGFDEANSALLLRHQNGTTVSISLASLAALAALLADLPTIDPEVVGQVWWDQAGNALMASAGS